MSNLVLCLLFGISLTNHLCAQNSELDSLKKTLVTKEKKWDIRIFNLYIALSKASSNSNLELTKSYVSSAQKLANKLNYEQGKGEVYYALGKLDLATAQFLSARKHFSQSLEMFEKNEIKKKYADCYTALGITYQNVGEIDTAMLYFRKSIEFGDLYNESRNASSLINLGTLYAYRSEFDKALLCLNKALEQKLKYNETQGINICYNNLGGIYDAKGDWYRALEHFQKANQIERKTGNRKDQINSYINIGRIYQRQHEFESAIENYQKSIEIAKEFDNKMALALGLSNIAGVFSAQGQNENAIRCHEEALELKRNIGDKREISGSLNGLGQVLLEDEQLERALTCFNEAKLLKTEVLDRPGLCISHIGIGATLIEQGKIDEALFHLLEAHKISQEFTMLSRSKRIHELLSNLYEINGNYKNAYYHQKQFKKFADSIFNGENTRKLTQLEYEHLYADSIESAAHREVLLENRVKQADLETANSKQRTLWWVIGFLAVLLTSSLIITSLTIGNAKSKIQGIALEQKLLRTQMTPHFIFNSMGVIQGMILNGHYKKSLSYISDFSSLIRLTLENSRDKTVSLEKELMAIQSYVALQNSTTVLPYRCEINVDNSINPTHLLLPPMLLQPFVENAIEHGFKEERDDRQIDITIQFDDHDLLCVITDNGIGIDSTKSTNDSSKNSMSNQIVKERLALFGKEFRVRTDFSIKDRKELGERGTMISMILPYKKAVNG